MKTIDTQKDIIRKLIKEEKRKMDESDRLIRSEIIFQKIERHPVFIQSELILMFYSMKDEVHTHSFLEKWYTKKQLFLPCVDGNVLKLREYHGFQSLTQGEKYNIPEPKGPEFRDIEKIELAIIPGVAFDVSNNRMGRGKAYYDQLLPNLEAYLIGICFDFQYLQSVPTDLHDVKMNEIIHG